LETAGNHVVELAMPFFVLAPWRPMLLAGGLVQIIFQARSPAPTPSPN
jgi:hypothetical protein